MNEIHPSACIHPSATLGARARVGPGVVVDEHVVIGDDCDLRAHAIVTGYTQMGDRNLVGYGAVIGAEPQDRGFAPTTVSYVRIGNDNIFRENVTIHRGTKPETETSVGNNNFLMAGAHLAHNCKVGNNTIFANNATCGGYVEIEDGAFLSGNILVHQFCRVGRLAMMRGGARISKDLPPFVIADTTNDWVGLNVVGMRRAGITAADRAAVKACYANLFDGRRPLRAAIAELLATQPPSCVEEILVFLQRAKKGVCFPAHQRSLSSSEEAEP
jgi:UDP-N-acetylglucosamine acyltransferase